MSFFSVMDSALSRTVDFCGRPFVYGGVTYHGVVNFLSTSEIIDFGGFQSHLSATISVNASSMPVPPPKGARITIDGVDRRVINVTNNNGVSWHISLEDITR